MNPEKKHPSHPVAQFAFLKPLQKFTFSTPADTDGGVFGLFGKYFIEINMSRNAKASS